MFRSRLYVFATGKADERFGNAVGLTLQVNEVKISINRYVSYIEYRQFSTVQLVSNRMNGQERDAVRMHEICLYTLGAPR